MTYGLPTGSSIPYGGKGFPQWVYDLAKAFNVQASTYPGHQESQRAEAGFAPNPNRLNRGIDWAGSVPDMQRLAEYLLTQRKHLEQLIWQNPQTGQKIGVAGGDDVSATPYYQADYAGHRDHVHTRQSKPIPVPNQVPAKEESLRPDFNEYPMWSPNNQSRRGTKIDLFLLHTQEGGSTKDGADRLARWLGNPANKVSYHYTVSQDAVDKGVTVVDVVDTDLASWSVLSANNRSINLCFAGSSVKWSVDEWMRNSKAIDAAAWLAVQDCKKYGIPFTVIAPPYNAGRAGISDHAYVTKVLKDGTHSDCGPNFPWPYFASKVAEYAHGTPTPVPPPAPPPPPKPPSISDLSDRQLLEAIYRKLVV
jgi:N-acetyl-anhydromuramyl-L-alanine amidase AmpD